MQHNQKKSKEYLFGFKNEFIFFGLILISSVVIAELVQLASVLKAFSKMNDTSYSQNFIYPPIPTPEVVVVSMSEPLGTENWKIFTNSKKRLVFKYPDNMNYSEWYDATYGAGFYLGDNEHITDFRFGLRKDVNTTGIFLEFIQDGLKFEDIYNKSNDYYYKVKKTFFKNLKVKKIYSTKYKNFRIACVAASSDRTASDGPVNLLKCISTDGTKAFSAESGMDQSKNYYQKSVTLIKVLETVVDY